MLWIKALHIVFVVTWFSGLFYLPRLFVYHCMSSDTLSIERFKVMERKLYYGIATPSAVLATFFGLWLLIQDYPLYWRAAWLHYKLLLVLLLWGYHIACGRYLYLFKHDANRHGHLFYRWFNEIPVLFLLIIVILVVVKPSLMF